MSDKNSKFRNSFGGMCQHVQSCLVVVADFLSYRLTKPHTTYKVYSSEKEDIEMR